MSPTTQLALTLIIPVRTSAEHSTLVADWLGRDAPCVTTTNSITNVTTTDCSGALDGTASLVAAVDDTLYMQPRDVTGTNLSAAAAVGSNVFVKIEEHCVVTSNYRCDRVPDTPDVLNGTQDSRMNAEVVGGVATGRYVAQVGLKRPGNVTLSVILAKIGGWYGEYFNNAFLQGVPALTRIDTELDYNWGTGKLTNEAADFVSVQWFGRIKAPRTEYFTFLVSADDGLRITIDGVLVADRWDSCCDDVSFGMTLNESQFYDTIIEYKELQETAHFKLEWVSKSTPRQVVPATVVYYPERVQNQVIRLTTVPGPTIATSTTADGDGLTNSTAGKRAYFYLQSRDWDGRVLPNTADVFEIVFTGPSEGGPTTIENATAPGVNSGSFAIAAVH